MNCVGIMHFTLITVLLILFSEILPKYLTKTAFASFLIKVNAKISLFTIFLLNRIIPPGYLGQPGYQANLHMHTIIHKDIIVPIVSIYYTNIRIFCVTCADGILRTSILWLAGILLVSEKDGK